MKKRAPIPIIDNLANPKQVAQFMREADSICYVVVAKDKFFINATVQGVLCSIDAKMALLDPRTASLLGTAVTFGFGVFDWPGHIMPSGHEYTVGEDIEGVCAEFAIEDCDYPKIVVQPEYLRLFIGEDQYLDFPWSLGWALHAGLQMGKNLGHYPPATHNEPTMTEYSHS